MKEVHGYSGSIFFQQNGILLKAGVTGSLLSGNSILNDKFIPYGSITGVELRKGFPFLGYGSIQINTKGEVMSEDGGTKSELIDNNIIKFQAMSNQDFENAAVFLRSKIQ